MTKTFCDICEKETHDPVHIVVHANGRIKELLGDERYYDPEFEVCPVCAAEMLKKAFNGNVIPMKY